MINIVGIGLNGVEGLTPNLLAKIEDSTILAGSDRLLNLFVNYQGKKVVFDNLYQGIAIIKEYDQQGTKITILATGDPLFFGIGRLLLQNFAPEKLNFYPHLSSIQLAFNKIKIPWQDAKIISIHGRSLDDLIPLLKKGEQKIFILTDHLNNPQSIASLYLSLDLPSNYHFYIAENLGSDLEKINTFFTQKQIEELSHFNKDFASLNVVILIRQESTENQINLQQLPLIGIPDQFFLSFSDRPGLLTKREIRLNILGELNLQPNQIIWDLGAGTGSVSIEIARLSPTSHVYGIEKTAMGSRLIEQNSHRFQVSNLTAINGEAPAILEHLPTPDRIFLGGSGGNLIDILEFSWQKLKPDGILVIALTTLDHFQKSLTWFEQKKLKYNVLQLNIARSIPINQLTRLSPLNPVNLITVKKTSLF